MSSRIPTLIPKNLFQMKHSASSKKASFYLSYQRQHRHTWIFYTKAFWKSRLFIYEELNYFVNLSFIHLPTVPYLSLAMGIFLHIPKYFDIRCCNLVIQLATSYCYLEVPTSSVRSSLYICKWNSSKRHSYPLPLRTSYIKALWRLPSNSIWLRLSKYSSKWIGL